MSCDVCRICLAGGVKMYSIKNTQLQDIFETITSSLWKREDRPDVICYICYSQLNCTIKLKTMSIQAEEIFAQLFAGGLDLTEETIPILHKRQLRQMLVSPVQALSIENNVHENDYIKQEIEADTVKDVSNQEKQATNKIIHMNNTSLHSINEVSSSHNDIIIKKEVLSPNRNDNKQRPSKKDPNSKKANLNNDKDIDSTGNGPIKCVMGTPNNEIDQKAVNKSGTHIEKDTLKHKNKKSKKDNKKESNSHVESETVVSHKSHLKDTNEHRTREKIVNSKTSKDNKIIKHNINNNDTSKHNPFKEDKSDIPNKNITKKSPSNKENKKSTQVTESSPDEIKEEDDTNQNKLSNSPTSDDKTNIDKNIRLTLRFSINGGHSKIIKRSYPFDENVDVKTDEEIDQDLENLYSCEICPSTFRTKSSLINHKKTHVRRYACDECSKEFFRSGHLNQHLRSHRNEKPYQCEVCDKRFVQLCHLQQHSRIHTGETPFSCDMCDKMFKQKSNLLQHKRKHTEEKPYCCSVCQKLFRQLSNLKQHNLRIHNEI